MTEPIIIMGQLTTTEMMQRVPDFKMKIGNGTFGMIKKTQANPVPVLVV